MKNKKLFIIAIVFLLLITTALSACSFAVNSETAADSIPSENKQESTPVTEEHKQENIPPAVADDKAEETTPLEYTGSAYAAVNNNIPTFTKDELKPEAFEFYSDLDNLGRCGKTMACVCIETMPTEDRESISQIKPTGWINNEYDFVDGKHLYNRCHLIGFQLTGENANEKNLITGTRYMNTEGMLPFENMIADYVKETENHVMYRVTPDFRDGELVARGVYMEAYSIEDNGDGICFNVYAFNVQPGVVIDYKTGENRAEQQTETTEEIGEIKDYILNTNSKKFHLPDCSGAKSMKEENKQSFTGTKEQLIKQGFEPCGQCDP